MLKSRTPFTQIDVARLAGVSQTTVSLVLNGAPTGSLPAKTRNKVLRIAKQLGYVPNRLARSLRARKTFALAFAVPDITNPFYPTIARSIQVTADRAGYDLLIHNTDGQADKEARFLQLMLEGRVDGMIGVFFHLRAPDFRPCFERRIAVVRIEAEAQETGPWPLDNVYVDNFTAAKQATEYLLKKDHRAIAMLASATRPDSSRVRGFRAALKAGNAKGQVVSGKDFSEHHGYLTMQKLLDSSKSVSAVFAANDLMAIGAMTAIRERGLRIPRDVAVVGFDDIPLARLVSPGLTTIRQSQAELGARAVALILDRLNGQAPNHGRSERAGFELITRGSA